MSDGARGSDDSEVRGPRSGVSKAPEGLLGQTIDAKDSPIIDTHQHLWDLQKQRIPWLKNGRGVLNRSYVTRDYMEAIRGLNIIKAIYMEVNVAPEDHVAEVEVLYTAHLADEMDDGADDGTTHDTQAENTGSALGLVFYLPDSERKNGRKHDRVKETH